ncbi:MAG TPA: ATP-binding cassette domain-containing protein [Propionicimonas sp.]|jgi:zinc transport system ATP-binding protein|uniref:metal ABC transporter ATP-binding protein n=1 Tax=Propionicimonas sp. TaxID=1955623 RepID=UPI002F404A42
MLLTSESLATPAISAASVDVVLNGIPIVRGASLAIGRGEMVAILGNNGSGKTTLMRALMGLVPHHGSIELFGTELGRFREWARVGYVPQRGTILVQQATAREVVASGRLGRRRAFLPESGADKAAIADALAEVGLADRARYPFVRLSGGQQQRVLIARALATGADLMAWDEPLAGVDRNTQELLAGVAARLKARGTTIVMVLHELGCFRDLIDRSIILADGRVMPPGYDLHDPGHGHGPDHDHPDHDHRAVHGGHEVEEHERPRAHHTGLEVG